MNRIFRQQFLAALAFVSLGTATIALADGSLKHHGKTTLRMREDEPLCEQADEECSNSILKTLSGLNFGHAEISGGWLSTTAKAAGSFSISAVSANAPVGDLELGRFEAVYLPGTDAVRLRMTLVDTSVLFLCEDADGDFHKPGIGRLSNDCSPEQKMGVGGALGEMQWDPQTHRFAGQWAQFNAVLNLIGSPQTMQYLRAHLNATLGVDAETIWHGSADGEDGAGRDFDAYSRAILGLSGVVRSSSSRWELNGNVAFRPALFGTVDTITNFGRTFTGHALYHYLTQDDTALSGGLEVRWDYWSDPRDSIGEYDSVTEKSSLFVGAVFGVNFAFSKY